MVQLMRSPLDKSQMYHPCLTLSLVLIRRLPRVAQGTSHGALRGEAVFTRLRVSTLIPYEQEASALSIHGYQQKIGSLLYAAINTRPDVARMCSRLAEFSRNPLPNHHHAMDRAIAYFYQTRSYAL
jgi:hypothetical protein